VAQIWARSHSGPAPLVPPIMPKPPASDTALANAAAAVPPIGALISGWVIPSSVQSLVVSMGVLASLANLALKEIGAMLAVTIKLLAHTWRDWAKLRNVRSDLSERGAWLTHTGRRHRLRLRELVHDLSDQSRLS
jgi:hypothetical protein